MKIQIYISNKFSDTYLPFLLFRKSILNIIFYNICDNVNYIYDVSKLDVSSNSIIIINIFCLSRNINDVITILRNGSCKVLIINTEYYKNHKTESIIDNFNYCNDQRFYLLEYNPLNYKYFKQYKQNINTIYVPPLYDPFLEHFYSDIIKTLINLCERILMYYFMGR